MPTVGSFQSAVQFVAGTNLALFTFANLRQPALEDETRQWAALTRIVLPSDTAQDLLRAGMLEFIALRRELEQRLGAVKVLCLWVAVAYAGLLLWTSCVADQTTDGLFLKVASIVGGFPAVILFGLNAEVRRKLKSSRIERQRLERLAMSSGL